MGSLYFVFSRRLTLPHCLSLMSRLLNSYLFLCVSLSTATRGSHYGVLCRSAGAGRVRRHVLQQLLPLPAVHPGPGPEQRFQPVGAERAPGCREVSRHTGPLMDRRGGGGGGLAKQEGWWVTVMSS